ncbi:MAG: FAD-binding oxidoreductase [Phycisphaerales bacterium]
MTEKEPSQIAAELAKLVRGDVHADIIHRVAYSTDSSSYRILPRSVVAPRDAQDVVAIVKYARALGLPVAPRGAGSGVAGESLCGGIVLDMTRYMNRITRVEGDLVTCEPGVVLDELNKRLAQGGRKIGPDPSSGNRATIGGVVGNNATGAHSLQYGHTSAYVEAIEAVLPDGTTVEFRNGVDAERLTGTGRSIAKDCLSLLTSNQAIID